MKSRPIGKSPSPKICQFCSKIFYFFVQFIESQFFSAFLLQFTPQAPKAPEHIKKSFPAKCNAHLAKNLLHTRSKANIKQPIKKIEACKKARTISPSILCRHCKFFHTAAGITQENPSRLPHSFLIFPIRKTSLFRFQI